MKLCELCKGLARMFCESDNASLCWDCDAKVHSANFLAARHSRSLLCHVCQSPTAWSAAGAKLGKTVSVCDTCRCVDRCNYRRDHEEESESVNDEETDYGDEEEIDDEEEDLQVVPWSSTPPPPASSSSSEDSLYVRRNNVSSKRMRETDDADLHSDDDRESPRHRKVQTSPVKIQRTEDRLTAPRCIDFMRLNDDSRTVDLESSDTS
ncbi:zinc finger protein CONSTANS-LIKE 4-like [Lycium barbarum]|uniref:zinc finger protein CONSTANS-LIKE 4-like n=1 Tax=Lycium barbarum TaxID=112863 RepID=UPI00293E1596|nr:zinc finger protein CONSTANS-LIKE 4-like [Lycium barbarum]